MRWPVLEESARLDVMIRVSPAYLLLPYSMYRGVWQRAAYTLLKYINEIPVYHPHYYLSLAFPQELRGLAARGYVWVANTRSFGKRNFALAEWLYWLDHARMPHIDAALGRFIKRTRLDLAVDANPLVKYIDIRRVNSSFGNNTKARFGITPSRRGVPPRYSSRVKKV